MLTFSILAGIALVILATAFLICAVRAKSPERVAESLKSTLSPSLKSLFNKTTLE